MIGALLLRPTRNSQGGYYFYSLMMGRVIACQQYMLLPIPCEVIDHVHFKAWQENTSTGLSILNRWREEIPDEPVHPHDMPNNTNNDDTTDNDSSYHPKDDAGSLPSRNELETESIAPIQAAPDEPEPIGVEVVNDNLQIEGVDYDRETIVTEPEVTHADDGDLFVPVELPANLVITPRLRL